MTKSGSFEFFDNYSNSVQNLQPELYSEIEKILNAEFNSFYETYKRKPVVLDIGSAGILPYNVNLTEKVVLLDLFDKPKYLQLNEHCEWITGDILSVPVVPELLKTGKFDFIVMSSLLHHLCNENNDIMKNLKTSFFHSRLLLSENGKICIFESNCSIRLAKCEDFFYPVYSRILLKILKFTYVRMVSVDEIITTLNDVGLRTECIPFKQPRYIAQMYWRIPTKIYPLKINAIFAYENQLER
jgi:SAM-dependent methyltransferase